MVITRGKRAVTYCRVSTNKEEQIISLNNQIDNHKGYLKKYGCISANVVGMLYRKDGSYERLEGIYADEGLSATKTKYRQAFKQMIQDAKMGKFDIIFVKNVKRWARSSEDFSKTIKDLKECNVMVIFEEGNFNSFDEGAELTLQVLAAAAQDESRGASSSIRFGIRNAQRRGKWTNSTVPYGYVREGHNLVIHPQEAEVVKRIFNMYYYDGFGYTKIARILNSEGLKTKKGNAWTSRQIHNMVTYELYRGILIQHKTETFDVNRELLISVPQEQQIVHEFEHLKIIESELFELVQQEKERRGKEWGYFETRKTPSFDAEGNVQIIKEKILKRGVGNSSSKHLFSSLLKCGNCGGAMVRKKHKIWKDKYEWVCQTFEKKGKQFCEYRNTTHEHDLIAFIKDEIVSRKKDKGSLEAHFRQHIYTYYDAEEALAKIEPIERMIAEIKEETDFLLKSVVKGSISEEQFEEMNSERQKRMQELEAEKRRCLSVEHEVSIQEMRFRQFLQELDAIDVDNLTNGILKRLFVMVRVYSFPKYMKGWMGIGNQLKYISAHWWFLGKEEDVLMEDMFEKHKKEGLYDEFEEGEYENPFEESESPS